MADEFSVGRAMPACGTMRFSKEMPYARRPALPEEAESVLGAIIRMVLSTVPEGMLVALVDWIEAVELPVVVVAVPEVMVLSELELEATAELLELALDSAAMLTTLALAEVEVVLDVDTAAAALADVDVLLAVVATEVDDDELELALAVVDVEVTFEVVTAALLTATLSR